MKLAAMITKLEKARASYVKKHGTEPSIWSWDEDEGLMLCSKITRQDCMRRATKPYMTFKIPAIDGFGVHL